MTSVHVRDFENCCNIRNDSVMFDFFDVSPVKRSLSEKRRKLNEAMKTKCTSRVDLTVSNVKTSHGLGPSAQETLQRKLAFTLLLVPANNLFQLFCLCKPLFLIFQDFSSPSKKTNDPSLTEMMFYFDSFPLVSVRSQNFNRSKLVYWKALKITKIYATINS